MKYQVKAIEVEATQYQKGLGLEAMKIAGIELPGIVHPDNA